MIKRGKILTGPHEGKIGKIVGKDEEGWTVVKLNDGTKVSRLPIEVEEVETIDLTPTWPELVNIIIALIQGGNTAGAREHLVQMATVAQMYVDLDKKGLPAAIQLKYTDLAQYGDIHEVVINLASGETRRVRIEEHEAVRSFLPLFAWEPEPGEFNQHKLYTK
jgi:hypothetical protein